MRMQIIHSLKQTAFSFVPDEVSSVEQTDLGDDYSQVAKGNEEEAS